MKSGYFKNKKTLSTNLILLISFLIGGIFYVSNTWSPSSYGTALRTFGIEDTQKVIGSSRPIRSDEWAVITPLTQATVNNNFERYNNTSVYREDLRTVYTTPLLDWGLIFKPTMWLYRIVNPAYAFSFHHYATFLVFIFGYAWLFIKLIGASQRDAFLFSSILFFTGYTQYWWSTLGGTLAFFPWAIISLELRIKPVWKILLFYWFFACWLIGFHFYVPAIIALAFVGFIILLAFRPQYFKKLSLLALIIASLAAAVTIGFYLKDYLINTWDTLYPGRRIASGGGLPFDQWISQILPTSQIHDHKSLIGENICEISTVGSFYTLATLIFLNYKKSKQNLNRSVALKLIILSTGFLAMSAWMLLPLPSWVGAALLWNRVPAARMLFAAGFLMLLIVFMLAQNIGLKITNLRVILFSVIVIASWYYYKYVRFQISFFDSWRDLAILVPIITILFFAKRLSDKQTHTAVLASVALVGLLSFGSFNPIQSAWLIFNRPETNVTKALDRLAAENPGKPIAVSNFPGAILNGWGYRSISHLLPTPHLEFFRQIFPDLPEAKFNEVFNRYAHIILKEDREPKILHPDAVGVPIDAFTRSVRRVKIGAPNVPPSQVVGGVDVFTREGKTFKVIGWAPWQDESPSQSLHLVANYPIKDTRISTMSRPDVVDAFGNADYLLSGFAVEFRLDAPENIETNNVSLCLVATNTKEAKSVVVNNNISKNSCKVSASNQSVRQVKIGVPNITPSQVVGAVDVFTREGKTFKVTGWAPWQDENSSQSLHLVANYPVRDARISTISRPDVVNALNSGDYLRSGFTVKFALDAPENIETNNVSLCLVATNTKEAKTAIIANQVSKSLCTNVK